MILFQFMILFTKKVQVLFLPTLHYVVYHILKLKSSNFFFFHYNINTVTYICEDASFFLGYLKYSNEGPLKNVGTWIFRALAKKNP